MIDVFIGFMDEEVYCTLDQIKKKIDKQENRYSGVYVIERGYIQPNGYLFERPSMSYKNGIDAPPYMDIIHLNELNYKDIYRKLNSQKKKDQVQLDIFKGLCTNLFEDRSFSSQLEGMTKGRGGEKTDLKHIQISLIKFLWKYNCESEDMKTAVIIRSPEMGMEPSLVRPYLRACMKSLKNVTPDDTVTVFMIAAGGAIKEGDKPGEAYVIDGSFFVGSSIEDNKVNADNSLIVKKQYGSELDLISLYRNQVGTVGLGEQDANSKLAQIAEDLAQVSFKQLTDAGIPSKTLLNDLLSGYMAKGKPAYASLTTSFFMGHEMKNAGAQIGLCSANTEDFHILNIMNSLVTDEEHKEYPDIKDPEIVRVNCDPAKISETIDISKLKDWLETPGYSLIDGNSFLSAIYFGWIGFELYHETVARAMNWSFPNYLYENYPANVDKPGVKDYYNDRFCYDSTVSDLPYFVFDPFRVEIASDILKDAAAGKTFKNDRAKTNGKLSSLARIIPLSILELYNAEEKQQFELGKVVDCNLLDFIKFLIQGYVNCSLDNLPPEYDLLNLIMENNEFVKTQGMSRDEYNAKVSDGIDEYKQKVNARKPGEPEISFAKIKIPIWIRLGKYKLIDPVKGSNQTVANVQDIPWLGYLSAAKCADRAYYRASNLVGLKEVNKCMFGDDRDKLLNDRKIKLQK